MNKPSTFSFEHDVSEPLFDRALTPAGRLAAAAKSLLDSAHATKRGEAQSYLIRQFIPAARELLANGSSIAQLLAEASRKTVELRPGPPVPRPTSEIERIAGPLSALGWCGLEIDFVRNWLKPAEAVTRYDRFSIGTAERSVTRGELRAASRPVTWRNDRTWNDQFPVIEEAE